MYSWDQFYESIEPYVSLLVQMLSPVRGIDVLSPVMLCLLSALVTMMALSLLPPASDQSDRGSGLSSDLYSSEEIEG